MTATIESVISDKGPSKWKVRRSYAVEPFIFIMLVSRSAFQAIQTNTIELQYCKALLNIENEAACLNVTAPYFTEVQTFTSRFWVIRSCTRLIIPFVCSFFLGPWSDKHGRKPLILFGSTGYLLAFTLWAVCSNLNLHPYYLLVSDIPLAVTGAKMMMVLAVYCYICDITTLENRATRLSLVQTVVYIGHFIGTMIAPYLRQVSYCFAYSMCSVIMIIGLLYIHFFLEESVAPPEGKKKLKRTNPFKLKQLKNLYESCYRKQSKTNVTILALVILLMALSLVEQYGEVSVYYLFLQNALGWTLEKYTNLHAFSIVTSATLVWSCTWLFSKYLKLPDMLTVGIVTFFRLLGASIMMFASDVWLIYLAKLLDSLSGMYPSVVRVFVSRIFAKDDLGKVFTLIGSLESLAPVLGSLIYNTTYNETIVSFPSGVFYVSGFLCVIMASFIGIIILVQFREGDIAAEPRTSTIRTAADII